jgi:hypothetical protein
VVSKPKITFGEMREMGVPGLLVYCSDYHCSHWTVISGELGNRRNLSASLIHLVMQMAYKVRQKKRGRPATGKTPIRAIRLSDEFMDEIDHWATQQEDQPGRSEAIRRLVERGLKPRNSRGSRCHRRRPSPPSSFQGSNQS